MIGAILAWRAGLLDHQPIDANDTGLAAAFQSLDVQTRTVAQAYQEWRAHTRFHRHDEAIAVDRAPIDDCPKLYEVRANLGLTLLAAGLVRELMNFDVALHYTGRPRSGALEARFSPLAFRSVPAADDTFNAGVTAIDIASEYEKM